MLLLLSVSSIMNRERGNMSLVMDTRKEGDVVTNKASVYQPEFILSVPKHLSLLSIGFSMDAGSSATKLVYRSKEDYENGRLRDQSDSSEGKLRLRFFGGWRTEAPKIIEFLRNNCDVQPTGHQQEWFQTGAQMQFEIGKLDAAFGIKSKLMSEMDATVACLQEFLKNQSLFPIHRFTSAPVSVVLDEMKGYVGGLMAMMQTTHSLEKSQAGSNDIGEYIKKILSTDCDSFTAELNGYQIEYPCLYVMCGSATGAMILQGDGKYSMGDFCSDAGKTFLGEGRYMTGAKDYAELIEMANRGDYRKVDSICRDIKNNERNETDWYSGMPDDVLVFNLGKLADEKYDGTYTKSDIANALLQRHCFNLTQFAIKEAKLRKVKSIIFGGSFVTLPIVRETIQRWFLAQTLYQPLTGDTTQVTMHILANPGFVGALGVWHKNLELDQ